jgi:hypothetical protein
MANYDRTAAWKPTPVTPDLVPAVGSAIAAAETKIVALRAMLDAMARYRQVLPGIAADWKVAGRALMRGMGREWYDDEVTTYLRSGLAYGPENKVPDMAKQVESEITETEEAIRALRAILP